jgi:transposase-like protein
MTNRKWSLEEKRRAVERLRTTRHRELAKELGVEKRQLYNWRKQLRRLGEEPLAEGREQELERENRQLREVLSRKVLEADFLQGALRRIEARRQARDGCGETASTKKSKK